MADAGAGAGSAGRTDLRLVPTAATAWGAAFAGTFNEAVWSWAAAGFLLIAGAVLLFSGRQRRCAGVRARTMPATFALACFFGATVAVHCAAMAVQREEGPLAQAAADHDGVAIEIRITGSPAASMAPGQSGGNRWTVTAELLAVTAKSTVARGTADVLIAGGDGWDKVQAGQVVRTTGTLKEARDGQGQDALLSASSWPVVLDSQPDVRQSASELKHGFSAATRWLPPDAAGLLPGMVTGDTSALPESLETDMKTTGMTHLTAVSGANCSLVLGAFILLARSLRLSRPLAAAIAACGLAGFVLMVGPDPSVVRAAVMGAVGLAAMVGGLRGRSLTFLCVATAILLLLDPTMAANAGFLLSVVATLGIVLLASRLASWIPSRVPRWMAAGVAVPFSAQLLCGPVIVALQPQFTPYALIANVVAGPLVAPVTIMGTLAVPLAVMAPWLAVVPVAVAGGCAATVAGVARFFAGLPGATMPWAEGQAGVAAMVLCSGVSITLVWMVLQSERVLVRVVALHAGVELFLDRMSGRRHGRLDICKESSGRKHQWLLPKTPGPRTPRRTPSAGGTQARPP